MMLRVSVARVSFACAAFAAAATGHAQTVITWGGSNSTWNSAGNWVGGSLPGPVDTAQLTAGFTTVDSTVSIGQLILSGGGIGGAANLTVTGTGTMSGGTVNNSAVVDFGGLLTISSGTLGGSGTLMADGGVALTNSINLNGGRTLSLAGNSTWSAGTIFSGDGSVLNNSGAFTISGNGGVGFNFGAVRLTINNSGLLTKPTGGIATLDAFLNNTGKVTIVGGGAMSIAGGGSNTGIINVQTGSALNLTGGTFTFGTGSSLNGLGAIQIAGAAANFNAVTLGTVNLGLSSGLLTGTGSFNGPLTASGGTIGGSGTLSANGGLNVVNSINLNGGRVLNVAGKSTWSGGDIFSGDGSVLNNSGSLTVTSNNNVGFNYGAVPLTINNSGTFAKTTATGTSFLDAVFNNTGTMNLASGAVSINRGGSNGGSINIASGAALNLTGGGFTFAATSILNGRGTIQIAGATATIAGTTTGNVNFGLSSGLLNGTGSFNGPLTASGGTIGGSGTLSANGGLNVVNSINLSGGRVLNIAGKSTWSGGDIFSGDGSVLNNSGSLTLTSNNNVGFNYGAVPLTINNSGTLAKTTATGTSFLDAAFNNTGTVNLAAGAVSINRGGSNNGTINVANGAALNLAGGGFTLNAGSVLNGGGSMQVAGATATFAGAATGNLNLGLSSGLLNGAGSFNGPLTASGGTIGGSGTLSANGGLSVVGTINLSGGRVLNAAGRSTWSGGNIQSGDGSVLNNSGSFTLTSDNNVGFNYGATPLTINNSGTFAKTTATGTSFLDAAFTNTGTSNFASGAVSINRGGSNSGTINVFSGAALNLTGGGFTFNAGSTLNGGGTIQIAGGTATFNGATVGTANFGLSNGLLNGAGSFAGPLTASGGTIGGSGTLSANGGLNVVGTINLSGGRVLNVAGKSVWSGGNIQSGDGSVLNNSGSFTLTSDNNVGFNYGASPLTINNSGTWAKATATGTSFLDAAFTNTGTTSLYSGAMSINRGGSNSGTINVFSSAALNLTGGGFTFNASSVLNGTGTIQIAGGTATFNGATAGPANFGLSSGLLIGSGSFNGPLTATGGTIGGSGTLSLNGGLNVAGSINLNGGVTLNVAGNSTWSAGNIFSGDGSTLNNSGSLTITSDAGVGFNYGSSRLTINNSGTFAKQTATNTTSFDAAFVNTGTVRADSGTMSFTNSFTNTGGTVMVAGGNLSFGAPLNVGAGKLAGSGTVTASTVTVGNGGVLAPGNSIGLLNVAGNLNLAGGPTSQFEIGGTARSTQYDGVDVTGSGTLGGTLQLSLVNAAYTAIQNSDVFTLLNASALTGVYGNIASGNRLTTADGAGSFLVNVSGTSVSLTQFLLDASTRLWAGGDLNAGGNVTPSSLVSSTVPSGTNFAIYTTGDHDFNAINLINNGTIDWVGGRLRSGDGGTITNNGLFNDYATSDFNADLGNHSTSFTNAAAATYRKTTGTSNYYVPFNNAGTIDVKGGVLNLLAGGTFATGSTVTSAGTAQLAGGTLTANGNINVSNFLLNGGLLAGDQTFNGSLTWLSTSLSTLNTTTIASGTTLTIGSNADHDFNAHNLVNNGTINWTAGRLRSGDSGVITNNALFNDTASSDFNADLGNHVTSFNNALAGTYAKRSGTANFYVPFNNTGAINVTGGSLLLLAGGTFADGSTASAVGPGVAELDAGTLTVNGTVTWNNFNLNGGAIAGTQAFSNSAFSWLTGSWSTPGTTTIGAGTVFTISSASDHDYNARAFVNNGTVNWLSGRLRSGDSGSITNNALFQDSVSSDINADLGNHVTSFTNAASGVYRKTSGTTNFLIPLLNYGAINVSGGILDLQAGGLLADGSALFSTGTARLTAGTLTASGTVNVSNFLLNGGTLAGDQTFAGNLTWLNTSLSTPNTTTIGAGTTFTITSAADHDFNAHAIVNNGIINWASGRLRSGDSGVITNNAAFNDSATSDLNADLGNHVTSFVNASGATYHKLTGTTNFLIPIVNQGTVDVAGGATLNLQAGGTLANLSTIASGGTAQLTGGTLTAAGTINVTNFLLNGGALAGDQTFNGSLTWLSSNLSTPNTTTIGTGATFTIASTADHDFNAHAIVNNGIVNWTAGRLRSGDSGSFTNNASFNDSVTSDFNADLGNHVTSFTNASGANYYKLSGATNFIIPFVNQGTIDVAGGATLNLAAGGTLANLSAIASSGTTQLTGGTLTASGTVNVSNFLLNGGALAGDQTFNGSLTWLSSNLSTPNTTTIGTGATFTIASAADHDFNAHAIVNNGTVNWTAGRLRSGDSGSFTNNGTINDSASSDFNADLGNHVTSFTNAAGANYNKLAAGTTTFFIPVTNAGTMTALAGTISFASTFTNSNGSLVAAGGNFSFSNSINLGTATLGGSGTITAPNVTAGGTVSPGNSPGTLTIAGNLTLLGTSALLIELAGPAAGTEYDVLSATGSVDLGSSTLSLTFTNGFNAGATPAQTFTIVSAASLLGSFSNVANGARLITSDGLGSFQVNYGASSAFAASSVVLSSFVAVPEPSTWVLLGMGLALIALQVRQRVRR